MTAHALGALSIGFYPEALAQELVFTADIARPSCAGGSVQPCNQHSGISRMPVAVEPALLHGNFFGRSPPGR